MAGCDRSDPERQVTRDEKLDEAIAVSNAIRNDAAEATRIARNGAPAQELVDQLGIPLTEADLIVALQKSEP